MAELRKIGQSFRLMSWREPQNTIHFSFLYCGKTISTLTVHLGSSKSAVKLQSFLAYSGMSLTLKGFLVLWNLSHYIELSILNYMQCLQRKKVKSYRNKLMQTDYFKQMETLGLNITFPTVKRYQSDLYILLQKD